MKTIFIMNENLLDLILEISKKQEILNKYIKETTNEILKDFSFSEMHCIAQIQKLTNPNVTKLSEALNMTRGGISKIIKRLISKGVLEIYTSEFNQKEIYYKLTEYGQIVNKEHEKIHEVLCNKDIEFISKIDKKKLEIIKEFLTDYNNYLENKLS